MFLSASAKGECSIDGAAPSARTVPIKPRLSCRQSPPTPPTAPSPDEDLHTRSSLDREEKLPSALCTPQVEEGPHIVKVRMGGDTEGAPLLKQPPQTPHCPGPSAAPAEKTRYSRFLPCQSLPRWGSGGW